jgi:hypothetical protein
MRRFSVENVIEVRLVDTSLPLLPADILDNLVDIGSCYRVYLRHIAELPMMGFDSEGRRALERHITVVIGFIDLVN